MDVIYLDFRKFFDNVPHKRLMVKVKANGFGCKICDFVDYWLSGRRQRVTLNGRETNWIDVLSEVPHGSVLGPVLFVINDIESYVSSKIVKFSDDTKIASVVSSSEGVLRLRQALVDLYHWSNDWLMSINTEM